MTHASWKQTILAIIILAALALAGAAFIKTSDGPPRNPPKGAVEPPGNILPPVPEDIIPASHSWKNGMHTYRGVLTMPTPCHRIRSSVVIAESFPEQVRIDLRREDLGQICIQVIAETPFVVQFEASENARVMVTLDGKPAAFDLSGSEPSSGTSSSPSGRFDDPSWSDENLPAIEGPDAN